MYCCLRSANSCAHTFESSPAETRLVRDTSGRDSASRDRILTTAHISCSRSSNISNLVLLGDEFSFVVVFVKLFLDFSRFAAGTCLFSRCFVSLSLFLIFLCG